MEVHKDKCIACGSCVKNCPVNAITWKGGKAYIDKGKCIKCGTCVAICPVDAIEYN